MPTEYRFFYGYIIVITSFFIMMAIIGMHSCFGIFFKPMIAELGWTRALTSGAFSVSMLMTGLLGIVIGGLNDRFGPRVVLTICGLLAGLGYLLVSRVHAAYQLYLFYGIIIGFGSGIFVPLLSTVARWFVRRRSMMSGIVASGMGVGMLFLPLIINRLISAYGWRVSCLILGIIIIVFVVVTAQFLRRDPGQVGQVPYGEGNTKEENPDAGTRAFSLKEALFTRQFWMFFAMLICLGFCFFSLQVHIAPYITDLGISARNAAKILATVGGSSIIGQIALGSIGDRIGNRHAFLVGTVLIAISVFGLALTDRLWTFYLFAVILGLAYGNMSTQESPLVALLFGLKYHGLIFGFFALSFTIGASVGPVVFGYLFDVTGSYRFAFLLCAAISILNILLTIFLKPTDSAPEREG